MENKHDIDQLIYIFSKLPGLGRRSARRIILHLLEDKDVRLRGLISHLENAFDHISHCTICGNIDYSDICNICSNASRSPSIITIVETVAELWAIERSEIFSGVYHVLGSNLSKTQKRTESGLRLDILRDRCKHNKTEELIIATNATLDGQTTAYFITEYFKDYPIKISRLASGVPVGAELDYLDEGTLSAALESRKLFV